MAYERVVDGDRPPLVLPGCTLRDHGEDVDAWLADRQRGLGASEAAAAIGASRYQTPLDVWARKRGLVDGPMENRAMRMGRKLEPVVASEYEEETGRTGLVDLGRYAACWSDTRPWQYATLDRVCYDVAMGGWGVVECKTTAFARADEWEDGVPQEYAVQLAHQLAVTGLAWGSLVVLVGGRDLIVRDYARDADLEARVLAAEAAFWASVQDPNALAPAAQAADLDLMARLHPREKSDAAVALSGDAIAWDAQRAEAADELKRWQAVKDECEARLKQAIGDAQRGVLPNGVTYSWTTQQRKERVVAAAEFRVLRRKEPKR